ncbi:hypothetical protein Tco_1008728 [Tanacetum coccineum]
MPISAGMTASVPYVSENGVSPLLDLIIVRLLFALSTRPFACGCFMEAKHWRMQSFSHQSLNGLSRNCFPLTDMTLPGPSRKGPAMSIPHL